MLGIEFSFLVSGVLVLRSLREARWEEVSKIGLRIIFYEYWVFRVGGVR